MIEKLKEATINRIKEIEQKGKYDPLLPLDSNIKYNSYNISRTIDDYFLKFPDLINYMKPQLQFLEIGAGEGIAFNQFINEFELNIIATNLFTKPNDGFVPAEASSLPFEDNSFDIVISVQSITWEVNQKKALQEIIRVLRTGGVAFINLYKFSEITTLWFGEKFWKDFNKPIYINRYQFDENDNQESHINVRIEKSKIESVLLNSFFLKCIK